MSFLAVVYGAHQCIAVYLLQVFMEDVVTAFTTNRITTEEGVAKAEMKYMMDGSIPDGGEWKMFSSCTCDLEPSIPFAILMIGTDLCQMMPTMDYIHLILMIGTDLCQYGQNGLFPFETNDWH